MRPRDSDEDSEPEQELSEHPEASLHRTTLLPGDDEIMRLLKIFFATIGAVFPCVDETTLLGYWKRYAEDKTRVIPRSAYALLNIIMAHASATIEDDDTFLFYHRSSHLLDMHTVQSTDIQTGRLLFEFRLEF